MAATASSTPVSEPESIGPPVESVTPSAGENGGSSEGSVDSPTAASASDSSTGESGWAGKLYYLALVGEQQQLLTLDLASGEEEIVFAVPELGWLSGAAVSPDGQQIVLAYSAPPTAGQVQFGFTDLYLMPADGSEAPTPLILKEDPSEAFFNVSWPLADTIYYAHVFPGADETGLVTYSSQIERISTDGTNREVLGLGGAWPRLAEDGTTLAYINDQLELIIAEADGTKAEVILESDAFEAIDAPLFVPKTEQICFSAVNPLPPSALTIWDRLAGVSVVMAHSVPSDWWCMSLDSSGEMSRLTNLNAIGLYGDFNEDGTHMAFITTDGLYIMRTDGSSLEKIKDASPFGTLDWVP